MDSTVKENALKALQKVGFGNYGSKVYLTLLEESPLNGYELANRSGVPRSKVYEVLEKIERAGAVVKISDTKARGTRYVPVEPQFFIASLKDQFEKDCEQAQEAVNAYHQDEQVVEVFWRVLTAKELVRRCRDIIGEATENLHVALWAEEFEVVYPELILALERGVEIALVLYTEHEALDQVLEAGAAAILHSKSKREIQSIVGRQFVMTADNKHCLTGTILEDGEVDGAYTQNRGMLVNALDLVNHEIYLERIYREFQDELDAKYGKHLKNLQAFDKV